MCSICGRNPCHPRCPNYELSKAIYYCSSCGEGICNGEKYIKNDYGEFRHYDCFCDMRDLLKWLGYEIRTMEDADD